MSYAGPKIQSGYNLGRDRYREIALWAEITGAPGVIWDPQTQGTYRNPTAKARTRKVEQVARTSKLARRERQGRLRDRRNRIKSEKRRLEAEKRRLEAATSGE